MPMPDSGIDLKVERIRAHIKLNDLAARMGVSRATLWVLEKSQHVSPEQAARYREALSDGQDVETVA